MDFPPPGAAERVAKWQRWHDESWARLDGPEKLAFRAWLLVAGQVRLLVPDVPAKKRHWVLDFGAAHAAMGMVGCPDEWRERVWGGIQRLHDDTRNKESGDTCFHGDDPLLLCDPDCLGCQKRWKCRCGDEVLTSVWCSEC